MDKRVMIFLLITALYAFPSVYSQTFVYRAKNPAFGGESFNYQWMLSSAESQNSFTDDSEEPEDSDLTNFADDINRQLLGRLNRILLDGQFDINGELTPGVYNFGDLSVEVFESTEGLVVNILDITTGEQTQVIVPN